MKKDKKKETKPILKSHTLGMLKVILLKFSLWNTDIGGYVHNKKLSCFVKAVWSYKCVKSVFSFFLSIYSWCGVPAFWAARQTTVCDCLDRYNYNVLLVCNVCNRKEQLYVVKGATTVLTTIIVVCRLLYSQKIKLANGVILVLLQESISCMSKQ